MLDERVKAKDQLNKENNIEEDQLNESMIGIDYRKLSQLSRYFLIIQKPHNYQ